MKRPKDPARKNNLKKLIWPLLIIIITVFVDQITKVWALNNLFENAPVKVFGNFFMLTLVFNEGGAMGTNFGSPTYYLISSLFILIFVLYYIYLNRNTLIMSIPLACIAGGAIGNIMDRIFLGRVIDFFDIDFFNINMLGINIERWWTFNIADAAISCSIIILLVHLLFIKTNADKIDQSEM